MNFESLQFAPELLRALADCGYTEPTPIQAQTIPPLLQGRDVDRIGADRHRQDRGLRAARACSALSTRSRAAPGKRPCGHGPRVLVLAPTRELAQQVADTGRALRPAPARQDGVHLRRGTVSGAEQQLARGVDILVATPGRLIDHLERGRIDLSQLDMLVLDEADRMLDMGFIEDVERIAARTPAKRQTVLFSATFDGAIGVWPGSCCAIRCVSKSPPARLPPIAIEQRVHFTDDHAHKHRILDHLLADITMTQSIVFIATKRDAETLAIRLRGEGHAAAALHGDMSQRERTRTLQDMRRGRVRTLVATDVAARGLDVAGISHVINFDLPRQADDYVHRIGRTGRAGATGHRGLARRPSPSAGPLRQIERYTGAAIAAHVIPGLEPRNRNRGMHDAAPSRARPRNTAAPARTRAIRAGTERSRVGLAGQSGRTRPLARSTDASMRVRRRFQAAETLVEVRRRRRQRSAGRFPASPPDAARRSDA